ncbi:MAG TPA: asparagine synthase (glutamine-hydrolyzing) [Thermoleophilaceae bacterium]|nr:asparagine synthase (glutamine-hydrolyzing) [Thermoleophilaceae bacterium]
MCGIAGILGFSDGFAADEATVTRMRDSISHRGPDDGGSWCSPADRVALGHRRLSIVDLSRAGHQPMSNEDGTVWITFNGEIYNHLELRAELEAKGHRYRSNTDSETIVHLWEEEGPACVERLRGMFAFAIWDSRRRELFLARDRVGVKPLFYAPLPGGLVFGSEMRALLEHPALTPDLDEESFFHFLTFSFAPAPRTMFAGVRKVAPAERITIRADGSIQAERYWRPLASPLAAEVAAMDETEMLVRLRAQLRESIGLRMMSDVPFGVFLSGGLDSSLNVALMSELTDRPVRTYTTAPRDYAEYDELSYARTIAEKFGTDHHEVVITDEDVAAFIPEFLSRQDEPIGDWTSIPQHFVSRLARDSGTIVVQVGEGADELFHGYKGYVDHRRFVVPFQRFVHPRLRPLIGRSALRATQRAGRGIRHGEALYDAATSPLPYWGGALCFRGELKRDVLLDGAGYGDSYAIVERIWAEAGQERGDADLFQRMTYVEMKQRLSEMLLMQLDRQTMANSIEGREPFLDHELVELALAMPPDMKVRDGSKKHALKRVAEDVLPHEIVHRPKQGFGTPMKEWLRGDLGRRAQTTVRGSSLAERGLLDADRIDAIFESHRHGRGDWSKHLWNLYTVSAWHDEWVTP